VESWRFVADVHLARLAKYLRLFGFDTLYFSSIGDEELIHIATTQGRTILTKDRDLARQTPQAYLVQPKGLEAQLERLFADLQLRIQRPFSRCMVDNTLLEPIAKEAILERIPPKVREWCETFWYCPGCQRIYWRGSHWERMQLMVERFGGGTP